MLPFFVAYSLVNHLFVCGCSNLYRKKYYLCTWNINEEIVVLRAPHYRFYMTFNTVVNKEITFRNSCIDGFQRFSLDLRLKEIKYFRSFS